MQVSFSTFDWIVLVAYFVGVLTLGLLLSGKSKSTENFTTGGRSLPGWLCGLSIFATFLSSISYLALPGKSFVDNWNPFVFSLALPFAAWIAVKYFVPLYRSSGDVSAYALLERRFGTWARIYASAFYLLFQVARIGVVMYLMALPMAVIFGWDIRWIIVFTGIAVTAYAFIGGIVAVIWADAIQAVVLLAGALIAVAIILLGMPDGPGQVFQIGWQADKFSLGSRQLLTVSQPTIWILFTYGLFENLKNFGIDQSYIQRYIAAKSDRDAARSLWLSAGLYVPVSALFFFIGTSLFAWYSVHPEDLKDVRQTVARQRLMQQGVPPQYVAGSKDQDFTTQYQTQLDNIASKLTDQDLGDRVFPHFISVHLPVGLTGLLIAAIFAAAMSTVSTSLNSSATLVMSDFYQRLCAPEATEKQLMRVLHGATLLWGLLGTGMAILLVRLTESALDVWWTLSSVLGSGILGIFLLGILSRTASNRAALWSVFVGTGVIAWMVLSASGLWPKSLAVVASPFHSLLVIVIGATVIVLVGSFLGRLLKRPQHK